VIERSKCETLIANRKAESSLAFLLMKRQKARLAPILFAWSTKYLIFLKLSSRHPGDGGAAVERVYQHKSLKRTGLGQFSPFAKEGGKRQDLILGFLTNDRLG
jgi:hypothetical protein